tara:strand:+ start:1319 stop:1633 length:315 start_codon:yes stop_codon:yes gene_type:complete
VTFEISIGLWIAAAFVGCGILDGFKTINNKGKEMMPNDKVDALRKIEAARMSEGLSVKAAAKHSIISQSNWCRISNGLQNPTWDTLCGMADAVGLDVTIQIKTR